MKKLNADGIFSGTIERQIIHYKYFVRLNTEQAAAIYEPCQFRTRLT